MSKAILIDQTIQKLQKLPISEIGEVNDFVEFLLNKVEEEILREGMVKITAESSAFEFLEEEEDLYSIDDLKERY